MAEGDILNVDMGMWPALEALRLRLETVLIFHIYSFRFLKMSVQIYIRLWIVRPVGHILPSCP